MGNLLHKNDLIDSDEKISVHRSPDPSAEHAHDFLELVYVASGKAEQVDSFVQGRELMGEERIGGLKTAYIKGSIERASLPEGLSAEPLSLQALFIHLTNS